MRRGFIQSVVLLFLAAAPLSAADPVLWYRHPASRWADALPIGNGRLGGMVFGGIAKERIALNEDTIWNGKKRDRVNPEALKALPEVRRLLFEGKVKEAEVLEEQKMMGIPNRQPPYQPLGDLNIEFAGLDNAQDYRRELNLATGVARVSYRVGEAACTREIFSSVPDQAIVVRLSCDKPGQVTFRATLTRSQDAQTATAAPDRVILAGEAVAHTNFWITPNLTPEKRKAETDQVEPSGVKFRGVLRAVNEGGKLAISGNDLVVTGANAATLLLVAATNYHGGDPAEDCNRYLTRAAKPYNALKSAHLADHERLFRRVEVAFAPPVADATIENLPTDERLARLKKGQEDPGLSALYFQFGRYLLMGSSRPGTMAANLQGIWNELMAPPWDSKYTTNINLQMNYWPAEVGNLSETTGPLFDLIKMSLESGRRTAKEMYGARGFAFHHNIDAWADTAPVDYAYCGIWPMGGAWLALHFWEHYQYGLDRAFLSRDAYPIMKEASLFLVDFLIDDGKGHLVTNPSYSPENSYRMADGTVGRQTVGATMDYELIYTLFHATMDASRILGIDADYRKQLESTLKRIPDLKIGKFGQLQEWSEDYEEPTPGMSHISHLFALYPADEITLRGTPELAKAARISLERRVQNGGGRSGWSAGWYSNLWARLEDGDRGYVHIRNLLSSATETLLNGSRLFQIDANFGGASGVAEMLLQSHSGVIAILPALPSAWPEGHFHGLRARGNVEVDASWKGGRAVSAALRPAVGGEFQLRPPRGQRIVGIQSGGRTVPSTDSGGIWRVRVEPRREYTITFE
ncbi:MAG TPA: glycoside hydrolase family 95 protein [Candidatus Limnocylindrales bacterium]|nr:glycoside hydrolase family 95 protein [Candidatus Limnocylindrales bacterium]